MIKLDNDHSFAVELSGKKARLIVYKGGVENVCRKESLKNIKEFIQSGGNHLFKGRLQLQKNTKGTGVIVKGEMIGMINDDDLLAVINL